MDRILIILKKENGPRASSAPALGLNTIIFKYVYWYMKQISGERLQDHWSSGFVHADRCLLMQKCIHGNVIFYRELTKVRELKERFFRGRGMPNLVSFL